MKVTVLPPQEHQPGQCEDCWQPLRPATYQRKAPRPKQRFCTECRRHEHNVASYRRDDELFADEKRKEVIDGSSRYSGPLGPPAKIGTSF